MEETIERLQTKISSKELSVKKMTEKDLKIVKLQSELQEIKDYNVSY